MMEEDHYREASEAHSLDELAKRLASGAISRRQALKLIGATIFGSMVGSAMLGMFPGLASAVKKGHGRRHHHSKHIFTPSGGCNADSCADGCCVGNTCHVNDPG